MFSVYTSRLLLTYLVSMKCFNRVQGRRCHGYTCLDKEKHFFFPFTVTISSVYESPLLQDGKWIHEINAVLYNQVIV